ncbi:hypothetical protein BU15DRAFT_65712 [Melanogaster broomeanus]|nr:hypothetical protein BU15DRAFT_65712 [Melanogaster broomeanus]
MSHTQTACLSDVLSGPSFDDPSRYRPTSMALRYPLTKPLALARATNSLVTDGLLGLEATGIMRRQSMRAGGATALTLNSVALYLIQAAGRWSSNEWQKYVRKHPYLRQALVHGRASSVSTTS